MTQRREAISLTMKDDTLYVYAMHTGRYQFTVFLCSNVTGTLILGVFKSSGKAVAFLNSLKVVSHGFRGKHL